jgi:transposase
MSQGILLNGPERRRKWHEHRRREIVSLAFSGETSVAEVARRFEISTSLIYGWRREFRSSDGGVLFSPAVIADGPPRAGSSSAVITVDFSSGARVSITAAAPVELVSAIMKGLG